MKAEFCNSTGAEENGCLATSKPFSAVIFHPLLPLLLLLFLPSSFILHPSSFAALAPPGAPPDIRGIVPPQPFYIGAFGGFWLALALVALLLAGYALWKFQQNRPATPIPPPDPRDVAARRLAELERQMESMDARTFGGAVADVLRAYIGAQYGLHPERQTSPEFLASITGSRAFTLLEHSLLSEFLEGCDLLKFARLDATLDAKRRLLAQAMDFVRSSVPPPEEVPPLSQLAAAKQLT